MSNAIPVIPSGPDPTPQGRVARISNFIREGFRYLRSGFGFKGPYYSSVVKKYNPWTGKYKVIRYERSTTNLGAVQEALNDEGLPDKVAGIVGKIVDAVKGQSTKDTLKTGETGASPESSILSALGLFRRGTSSEVGPAAVINSLANHLGINPSHLEGALKTLANQQAETEKLELEAIFTRAKSGDATEIIRAAKGYVVEKQEATSEDEITAALGALLEKYGGFEQFVQKVAGVGKKEKPNDSGTTETKRDDTNKPENKAGADEPPSQSP